MALQDNPRVAQQTRARVHQLAAQLGYTEHSNREARALIGKRYGKKAATGIIAVFMPRNMFAGTPVPGVPFFEPFIRGVETAALESELDVFLCTLHAQRLNRMVAEGNVDGVICLSRTTPELEAMEVPLVVFNHKRENAYSLLPQSRHGMEMAVAYLAALGHKNIAYLGFAADPDYQPGAERLLGYRCALGKHGLRQSEDIIEATLEHPTVEAGARGVERLLERTRNFTALVCFNDLIAMGAIERLQEQGVRVPQDVSVVGFDDVSESYRFEPALTTLFFDRYLMGCRAVQLIREATASSEPMGQWRGKEEIFGVTLKARASSGPPNPKFRAEVPPKFCI